MSTPRARKRFGQNFLVDRAILADCVAAIDPKPGERLVEIGPGLGALSAALLERIPALDAIEIDRDIVAYLAKNYPAERLHLHNVDALKFDFSTLGDSLRIVGNLPYNISTPLLFHLAGYVDTIIDLHFMLQKEVVERMAAGPGGRDYGRLSVMLQCDFVVEPLFDVPGEAFNPVPQVESSFVRLMPLRTRRVEPELKSRFEKIVATAFSQRRKTVRNALRSYFNDTDFHAAGIDAEQRPENLSVEQFAQLARHVTSEPKYV